MNYPVTPEVILYTGNNDDSNYARDELLLRGIVFQEIYDTDPDLPLPYLSVKSPAAGMDAIFRGATSIVFDFADIYTAPWRK